MTKVIKRNYTNKNARVKKIKRVRIGEVVVIGTTLHVPETMHEDGLEKARVGLTTIEEVLRVTEID